LRKQYDTPAGPIEVLAGVSFELQPGDGLAVTGPSGSGKSTLLHVLGALDPPSSGRVTVEGRDPYTLAEKDLASFRNRTVGFVFQDHSLLPQCSALENVLVPTLVAGGKDDGHEARARALLEEVGLGQRLHHRPAELSGGEKQRVALARALVLQPRLLLCDEPTGNLDPQAAEVVGSLLVDLHRRQRTVLVVVTHSESLAARLPRRARLWEGLLQG
jgi:lipoprotein-releasing system ATP-binding protein